MTQHWFIDVVMAVYDIFLFYNVEKLTIFFFGKKFIFLGAMALLRYTEYRSISDRGKTELQCIAFYFMINLY